MSAMKGGLRPSRFLFSLEKKFFTDFTKILAWAKKYANTEEVMVVRKDLSTSRAEKGNKRRREESFN